MRLNLARLLHRALPLTVLLFAACKSTSNSYTIGGTAAGLTGSGGLQSVVLQNNGGDTLTVSINGAFTFAKAVTSTRKDDATYNVTVLTQPIGQTCTVTNGSGTAKNKITNVLVNCSSTSAFNAYVVNEGSNNISQFTIGAGGVLTPNANVINVALTGTNPHCIAVAPSGQYAYVANYGNGTLSQYTIGNDGTLTPMTPATVTAGSRPYSIAVTPSGLYAYVANSGDGTVSQFAVGSDGTLTAITNSPVATGLGASAAPASITVDPSSHYVYVANSGEGSVSEYTIGNDGSLTAMTPATVPSGSGANSAPISIKVDPSGQYVYAANSNEDTVSQYTIGAGGVLTPLSPATVTAGSNPASVTVNPLGSYAYVANYSSSATRGSITEYSIGSDGALAEIGTVTTGKNPISITVDPTGLYAYVANYGDGSVSQFTISSGVLTTNANAATVSTGSNPISVITTQ